MASQNEFVVRFAGEGGQGVVTAAEMLARAATNVGFHALTFATFPSQILGGPTWTQARVSPTPLRAAGDYIDILVAFNSEAYEEHRADIRQGGIILHDPTVSPRESKGGVHALSVPFDELAKSTGETRAANMVVMGALSHLVNMPLEYFKSFVKARFSGREAIIEANLKALDLGFEQVSQEPPIADLGKPRKPRYEQLFIKGNEALCVGAIAGGLEFYAGYPISPATPVLLYMEKNLIGPEKFAYQVSSEIEAIGALLGAGFAGKKAMTATSGPGFSLMSEGIGLGWMAEIPCVVVDVQRGGPATGLPTKTEQSDLMAALHPAHGDAKMPILAPGTVEECFNAGVIALNWAERYQGPVVVLSEHSLAERAQNIRKPDVSKITPEVRMTYRGKNGYKRYDGWELSPMPIPGNPGAYVANGSEHDSMGDTTHLGSRHVQMTERRFSKLRLLEDGTYERKNQNAPIAIMPWGGSKGPVEETFEILASHGYQLGWYYTMYIHPLPPSLLKELRAKDLVLVPELNYQGQFSSYLRTLGIKAESITKYTGLPFRAFELAEQIKDRVNKTGILPGKSANNKQTTKAKVEA